MSDTTRGGNGPRGHFYFWDMYKSCINPIQTPYGSGNDF